MVTSITHSNSVEHFLGAVAGNVALNKMVKRHPFSKTKFGFSLFNIEEETIHGIDIDDES